MDKKDNAKDLVYTIVLDPRYPSLDAQEQAESKSAASAKAEAPAKTGAEAAQGAKTQGSAEQAPAPKPDKDERKAVIDRLYAEYEKMCYMETTVVDQDDAYPHSYQWRIGDRYDEAKVAVVREALMQRKLIADTDAYQIYVEEIKGRSYRLESWD